MNEIVSEEVRDITMERVLQIPENHFCFDCGNKNPNWASANLGVKINKIYLFRL
jgi:hypothetical protein